MWYKYTMEYYSAIKKNEIMSFNGWTQRLSCVLSHSVVSNSATPWTAAHQAPLSMGFSRQECQSVLPCPPPGDLRNPGIKPRSSTLQADSLPSEPPGKPKNTVLKGEKRMKIGQKNIFEEIMTGNFPNLVKEIDFYLKKLKECHIG